jgi:hypothetical protein
MSQCHTTLGFESPVAFRIFCKRSFNMLPNLIKSNWEKAEAHFNTQFEKIVSFLNGNSAPNQPFTLAVQVPDKNNQQKQPTKTTNKNNQQK